MKNIVFLSLAFAVSALAQSTTWTATSTPVQAHITGGPWTINNGALVNPSGSGNYCPSGTSLNSATTGASVNTGVNLFQPYYFPFISGRGQNIRGLFDYRPHDVNEAVVAASSTDGGFNWTFTQMAEQLTPACPGPISGTTTSAINTDNSAATNGNDAGFGHPHLLSMGGANYLYLLDRSNGHADSDNLIVRSIRPTAARPIGALPLTIANSLTNATTIAAWDFNSLSIATNNSPAPSVGTGTAQAIGLTNNYAYAGTTVLGAVNTDDVQVIGGSSDPVSPVGANHVWRIRGRSNSTPTTHPSVNNNGWNLSAPQYSQGAEFDVSTAGRSNIVLQFDWFCTNQGIRTMQVQYSTNVTASTPVWTNIGPLQVATPNAFTNLITISFVGITAVENNPNFGVRMVSAYDPSYTASSTYTSASLSSAYPPVPVVYNNNSGNWSFDEVRILSLASATTPTVGSDFSTHTTGLINPDGIMAVIPTVFSGGTRAILYVSKTLYGISSPANVPQCGYTSLLSRNVNYDYETVRLATTTDGIHFTDLGTTNLSDPTTISPTGRRYASPNGSIVQLANGNLGLFFGTGNCLDGDSDGFHAIGYAEVNPTTINSLLNWNVIYDIDNPIAAVTPVAQTSGGTTYPTRTPVVGPAQTFFGGRIYGPMAVYQDSTHVNLLFAGYNLAYENPGSNYTNYRSIGIVTLQIGNNTIQ